MKWSSGGTRKLLESIVRRRRKRLLEAGLKHHDGHPPFPAAETQQQLARIDSSLAHTRFSVASDHEQFAKQGLVYGSIIRIRFC